MTPNGPSGTGDRAHTRPPCSHHEKALADLTQGTGAGVPTKSGVWGRVCVCRCPVSLWDPVSRMSAQTLGPRVSSAAQQGTLSSEPRSGTALGAFSWVVTWTPTDATR